MTATCPIDSSTATWLIDSSLGVDIWNPSRDRWLDRLNRVILTVTLLKLAASLCLATVGLVLQPALRTSRLSIFALFVLSYGAAALWLVRSGAPTSPAYRLGLAFALIAEPYAGAAIDRTGNYLPTPILLNYLQVSAFQAYAFWSLALVFPRAPLIGRSRRLFLGGRAISLWIGLLLFVCNLLLYAVNREWLAGGSWLDWANRRRSESLYWPAVLSLVAAAWTAIFWKSSRTTPPERRRLILLCAAFGIGGAPVIFLTIVQSLSSSLRLWLNTPPQSLILLLITDVFLLSIPFFAAYAILVQRVIDVRYVLQRSVQYLLARYTALLITVVPLLVLGAYLILNREQSLASLIAGRPARIVLPLTLIGLVTMANRRRWLSFLDRTFFRDQYDALQILTSLVDKARTVKGVVALSELVGSEIERAFHISVTNVLVLDRASGVFVTMKGEAPSLPASSSITKLFGSSRKPNLIDPTRSGNRASGLSEVDAYWLADCGISVVAPLRDAGGALHGLLALGEKNSEMPYTAADLDLLESVATAASARLEHLRPLDLSGSTVTEGSGAALGLVAGPMTLASERSAGECPKCLRIFPQTNETCLDCGAALLRLALPIILFSKYRLESRIGSGGMGVVYRASEMSLNRSVAIKTLPRMSSALAGSLKREARAIASLTHPNLAVIYGAESWHGFPLLVLEYLEGGTLSSRINRRTPLPMNEVVDLGLTLCSALECIHKASVIHRDIKPSNLGFTLDGRLKVMDFGLATVLQETSRTSATHEIITKENLDPIKDMARSRIAGTLPYLSPEALRGAPPDFSFDIWSTCVVLYEAASGVHPFWRKTARETWSAIQEAEATPIDTVWPSCPDAARRFFDSAFSLDMKKRPQTATQLRSCLTSLL